MRTQTHTTSPDEFLGTSIESFRRKEPLLFIALRDLADRFPWFITVPAAKYFLEMFVRKFRREIKFLMQKHERRRRPPLLGRVEEDLAWFLANEFVYDLTKVGPVSLTKAYQDAYDALRADDPDAAHDFAHQVARFANHIRRTSSR